MSIGLHLVATHTPTTAIVNGEYHADSEKMAGSYGPPDSWHGFIPSSGLLSFDFVSGLPPPFPDEPSTNSQAPSTSSISSERRTPSISGSGGSSASVVTSRGCSDAAQLQAWLQDEASSAECLLLQTRATELLTSHARFDTHACRLASHSAPKVHRQLVNLP